MRHAILPATLIMSNGLCDSAESTKLPVKAPEVRTQGTFMVECSKLSEIARLGMRIARAQTAERAVAIWVRADQPNKLQTVSARKANAWLEINQEEGRSAEAVVRCELIFTDQDNDGGRNLYLTEIDQDDEKLLKAVIDRAKKETSLEIVEKVDLRIVSIQQSYRPKVIALPKLAFAWNVTLRGEGQVASCTMYSYPTENPKGAVPFGRNGLYLERADRGNGNDFSAVFHLVTRSVRASQK